MLHDADELRIKFITAFDVVKVQRNTIHGTDFNALWGIKMAHAFGAFVWIDLVDLDSLVDRAVRALRLTDVTVNAFISNHQSQN